MSGAHQGAAANGLSAVRSRVAGNRERTVRSTAAAEAVAELGLGRMKSHSQLASVLVVVALTGCIALPLPNSAKRIEASRSIHAGDLAFVRCGETTREQFESRLGKPWTNYVDLHVSVYYWEAVTGRWVWGFVVPAWADLYIDAGSSPITRLEILCVAFDESDIIRKFQIMRHPENKATKEVVAQWLRLH